MKINWKARLNNPVFIAQTVLAIILPILTYMGLTVQDLTSWSALFDVLWTAISNPYVLVMVIVSVWNALNDPTTAGLSDSTQALTYSEPKKQEDKNYES